MQHRTARRTTPEARERRMNSYTKAWNGMKLQFPGTQVEVGPLRDGVKRESENISIEERRGRGVAI